MIFGKGIVRSGFYSSADGGYQADTLSGRCSAGRLNPLPRRHFRCLTPLARRPRRMVKRWA